jgi:hypothetical protein
MEDTVSTSPCIFSVNVPGDEYELMTPSSGGSPGRNRSKMIRTSFQGKHVKSLSFHYARPDSTLSPNTRSTHPAAQEICFLSIYLHFPPSPTHQHVLLEFKSDLDLLSCLELLRTHDGFRKVLVDLPQKHFSSYAKALLSHYEAQQQNGTVSKCRPDRFIGDRDPDHILLSYPILGANPEEIEAAARNLTEAKGPPLARSTTNPSPNLPLLGGVTLRVKDYVTLAPGELLNDNVVNFWLCWYVTL